MKKRIFAKITAFILLMTMLFSITAFADGYTYGYYVHNVECTGDGEVEATIVFASNTYGSDVDVKGVGVLAVFDETQTKLLKQNIVEYNETAPFLTKQRFSVAQTVSLPDLTLERYVVKFIFLESEDYITPAAYVSTGTNAWVLESDDIPHDLVIDPQLFEDFYYDYYTNYCEPNIRYYKNADDSTVNTASKIEAPFEVYINKGLAYQSGVYATVSEVAYILNSMIGGGAVNKVTTNNKAYRFRDTDNNGYYDKLIIENSASFVVGKITASDYQIYRDNSASVFNSNLLFSGTETYNFSPLDLDTSDGMVSYNIEDTFGKALAFSDIKIGDVLNVAMSVGASGEHNYDIIVSTPKAVTGTVMRMQSKRLKGTGATIDYYTINDIEYRMNGAASSSKLEPGVSGTFYLTNDNSIISYDLTKNYSYGIVVATGTKIDTFENSVQTQIMTENGKVKDIDFAETVYVYESNYETIINSRVDADTSTVGFQANSSLLIPAGTVVIYETNSVGEIKKIYTTTQGIEYKENYDVEVGTLSLSSYSAAYEKIDGKYIIDETVIIGVPSAALVGNKDKYFVASKNALVDEEYYNGTIIYDADSKEAKFVFLTNLIPTEIEDDTDVTYSYGIVIATAAKTDSFSNGVQAMIMTENEGVKTFDFAQTVTFNDSTEVSSTRYPMNPEFNIYSGTVVAYETNEDNQIIKIYTTASAIETKENNDVKVGTLYYSVYSDNTGEIDGKYITDETIIIGVPSAGSVGNKDNYFVAPKNALLDEECYNGTIIYDAETREVKFAFTTNLLIKPAYDSSPMVVTEKATVYFEDELRTEFTGLINGEKVRYVLEGADDLTVFGMTDEVVAGINTKAEVAAFDIGVNDVIQIVTNNNDEIVAYRHIMKYDQSSRAYLAMVATAGNEDNDAILSAVLTNLSTGVAYVTQPTNKQMYGYAVSGRVNKVTSRGVEIFKDPTITSSVADLTAQSNIIDAVYNPSTPVYIYGSTYSKIETTVFESIKTFDIVCSGFDYNITSDIAKADDVVYLYSFDGENVLNFIVDVYSNN